MRHQYNMIAISLFASAALIVAWLAQAKTMHPQAANPKNAASVAQPSDGAATGSERATFAERFGSFN